MSLTKRECFDQMEANALETRITNINRHLSLALRAACDCESPDYETLDTICRAILSARDEINNIKASISALELMAF